MWYGTYGLISDKYGYVLILSISVLYWHRYLPPVHNRSPSSLVDYPQ